jgi:GT2 family glycosyltransferase
MPPRVESSTGPATDPGSTVKVSALITAYRRRERTIATIDRLLACTPPPDEIIVHVDGGESVLADEISNAYPEIRVILAGTNVGPGGGRSALLAAARNEICASFDDDSFPILDSYFQDVARALARHVGAAIICGPVIDHQNSRKEFERPTRVAWFSGGACVYRKERVIDAGPYVPLPIAYGMEEVDLSLRLHALGRSIVFDPDLAVFHDSDLAHHATARINAFSLSNVGLHCYLRYPLWLWPLGAAQIISRIAWCLRSKRIRGLLFGLSLIPIQAWKYRRYRRVVSTRAIVEFIRLKRHAAPSVPLQTKTGRRSTLRL